MCDNDKAEMLPTRVKTNITNSVCMKCKTNKAIVVVHINDPLCKSCFTTYITHKFRSTLGKAKLIKADDNVLLAVSGGHSSTAMLHLVSGALSESAHKRLKFNPAIIYIDESCLTNSEIEIENNAQNEVKCNLERISKELHFPFYSIPIYSNGESSLEPDNNNLMEKFLVSFNSIASFTAKTDFLSSLRTSQIASFARQNNFTKILIGENSTGLSVKLMYQIAQGRGSSISQDVGVADRRHDNLVLIRPMREFSSKEVAMFNRLNDIDTFVDKNLDTKTDAGSSLQRQAEEFIIGLQADFPSTVSTVFRTGEKVSSIVNNTTNIQKKCALCSSLITEESSLPNGYSSNDFKTGPVGEKLCYGCSLTFKDMTKDTNLIAQYLITD